jgi:hypothetical protein
MRLPLLIFLFVWAVSLKAQVINLPDSNAYWLFTIEDSQSIFGHFAYFFPTNREDTIVNNKTYFKAYKGNVGSAQREYMCAFRADSNDRGYIIPKEDTIEYKAFDYNLNANDSIDSLIVFTPITGNGNFDYLIVNGIVNQYSISVSTIPNQPIEISGEIWQFNYNPEYSPFNICCAGLTNVVPICVSFGDTVFYSYQNTWNQDFWVPSIGSNSHCIDIDLAIPQTEKPKFKIFPNPAGSQITVDCALRNVNCELEITTALGQIVYQSAITNPKSAIDVSGFVKGIYLLRVKEKEEVVFWEKLIIE